MRDLLLEFKNFSLGFKSGSVINEAIHSLSYDLKEGECLGIVGESGSGKSISSLSILGLLPDSAKITEGKISYHSNGKTYHLNTLKEIEFQSIRGKEIGMIFQEPMTSLNPVIKCGEQVAESLRLHKKLNRKEAYLETIKWFEKVLLPRPEEIYNSYPHQISGGQKQRVMIAIAMCCNPKLLIADEPTTALDVTVQKEILHLIKSLQKEYNMSVIFITHDLGVVAEIADNIMVMQNGRKVEENNTVSLFKNPQHPYTKGLINCRPPLEFRLKRLPIVSDFLNKSEAPFNEIKITFEERNKQLEELFKQEEIIKVNNLCNYFPIQKGLFRRTIGYVKAVDDVSFSVYKGETLGLVGESGCGKTTLGRSILNLIHPSSGDVIYNSNNISKLSSNDMRQYRKDLQIIFQDPYSSLNPRMSIGNAITEPMKIHRIGKDGKERKEIAIDLMETVGLLPEHFNRYPHQFSGGQRQRVSIARAIGLKPKFIICDESVSALDVSVQAQVLNLLNDLKQKHQFTYIFISHDLSVVKYMSDRIIVMKEGKIEEMGIAEEIYNKPKSTYTRQLIDSIPKIEPLLN